MLSTNQILQIVVFLDLIAISMILSQVPPHAKSLGCNHLMIGSMGALYSATQLLSGPISNTLSDIKGNRNIQLLYLIICGVTYLMLGLTSSITFFILLRGIQGFFSKTQTLTRSLALEYEADVRKRAILFGELATLTTLAPLIGPILAGYIMEEFPKYGFTVVAFLVGALFAVNSNLLRKLPEINKPEEKETNFYEASSRVIDSVADSLKQTIEKLYKVDWIKHRDVLQLKIAMILCMGVYFCNAALFLRVIHGVSPSNLGYILSLRGLMVAASKNFIGDINNFYRDDSDLSKRDFHFALVLAGSFFCMAIVSNVFLYIIFLIPSAVCDAVLLDMISSQGEGHDKEIISDATSTLRSMSGIIAPLIAGVVGEYFGIQSVFFASILFACTGTFVSYKLMLRSENQKTKIN